MARHHFAGLNLGNVRPLLQQSGQFPGTRAARKMNGDREILAAFCRALDPRMNGDAPRNGDGNPAVNADAAIIASLSPRVSQTLDFLLAGDSEKQIARKLQLSRHTVHVYVKSVYRNFNVNSRGELLARFVVRR